MGEGEESDGGGVREGGRVGRGEGGREGWGREGEERDEGRGE